MGKQKYKEEWQSADDEVRKNLPPGLKLVRTLRGHTGAIGRIAWSPDGRLLASPSVDKTIRLWDVETGECMRTLEGHASWVNCVAFDPAGRILASGSDDNTVKLWDLSTPPKAGAASRRLLRTLKGHHAHVIDVAFNPQGNILASANMGRAVELWEMPTGRLLRALEGKGLPFICIAFDPVGRTLATGSADGRVELWQPASGELLCTLNGHSNLVVTVAFDPSGRILASASRDSTIKLWQPSGGRLLRTLEGHKGEASGVAFSLDGRVLASKGDFPDNSISVWRSDSGLCVAKIPELASGNDAMGLAFHPRLPLLATVGSDPGTAKNECDRLIHIWELDLAVLLGQAAAPTVTYTSAKVVLVGESNVGKSYLAHRIATGRRPRKGAIKTTHGMKFWQLEPERLSPAAKAPENQRRDVVLWDMGGQEEYRLIHQLFLHDTTVALVLLDPTRGATAFKEAETWNKYLDKQLQGRAAVKLLVGAKLDQPSDTIDRQGLERLRTECGFKDYYETSAITGRGVAEFCEAVANAIDWDGLGLTSRPELFQRIRDEIESRRKHGEIVFHFADLKNAMIATETMLREAVKVVVEQLIESGEIGPPVPKAEESFRILRTPQASINWELVPRVYIDYAREAFSQLEVLSLLVEQGKHSREFSFFELCQQVVHKDVWAVTEQLATQGVIARSRVSSGEPVLVLQVQEIERYAGSLIVAARNNPRGVPALELKALAQAGFPLPGIADKDRLPLSQERPVLECTVQLLLEHGICFQHEGLLIFPTLFPPAPVTVDAKLPHAVSLYYDFAGAIDNIYASLVAWLVLARDFGKVRLWSERAEFEVRDGGLCGLRKVARPGGFAHVDVYFEADTPEKRRQQFISFVEEHLQQHGVEIRERIVVPCPRYFVFDEETLRMRIAEGAKDVLCPRCEERHSLIEGAAEARKRDPMIMNYTWALKTEIEKRRQESTDQAVQVLVKAPEDKPAARPIRLLHLSDLHFNRETPIPARLRWLLDDIKLDSGLDFQELDYLVISGDFTDKGCTEGFEKAYDFVSGLTQEFGLSAERCIFVPGNHDVNDLPEAFEKRTAADGQEVTIQSDKYSWRFKLFSEVFFHKFLQRPYPLDYAAQGMAIPFWETGIQFLALNSCWQIDQFNRKRAGLLPEAVAYTIKDAQKQESEARKSGQLAAGKQLLRIAVWHHSVSAPDFKMVDIEFLGNLQKSGVRLALHGDVHEMRRDLIGYWHEKKLHIVGSGSFGARANDRPESMPRLYNVLEIARDFKSMRVHTRCQPKPDGPWDGWHEWPKTRGGKGRVPYYDIKW